MEKKILYIVNVEEYRDLDLGELGYWTPVKHSVVFIKEDTDKYKEEVLKKISAPYVEKYKELKEFHQTYINDKQGVEDGNEKYVLKSEWVVGYAGYNKVSEYRAELIPVNSVEEL